MHRSIHMFFLLCTFKEGFPLICTYKKHAAEPPMVSARTSRERLSGVRYPGGQREAAEPLERYGRGR